MKIDPKVIIIGFFLLLVWSLGRFLVYKDFFDLFSVSVYLIIVLVFIFNRRGYYNKVFYLAFLGIIILQGLILTYTYLFISNYANNQLIYGDLAFFIIFIVLFAYMFIHRKKYLKKNNSI